MATTKKLISIVAPMYNEEVLVDAYFFEVKKITELLEPTYLFEIIMVNDGSSDATYDKILELQDKYPELISSVCLSRNFGLEGAVSAGLKMAAGDAVVVMDADLQDPPHIIPTMIRRWEEGADVVTCARVKRSHDGFLKRLSANFYYRVLNSLAGKLQLEQSAANFRLLSRKAVDTLLTLPETNTVFRVTVPFIGMKKSVIEYDRDQRYAGKTKYRLATMIPYALSSITGISVAPLRWIGLLIPVSAFLSVLSFLSAVSGGVWRMFFLLLGCNLLLFTVLLGVLCVLAEYVGQIFIEAKGRPASIIGEYRPAANIMHWRKA